MVKGTDKDFMNGKQYIYLYLYIYIDLSNSLFSHSYNCSIYCYLGQMVQCTREPGLRTNNMEKEDFIKMGSGTSAPGKMVIMKNASYSNIIDN